MFERNSSLADLMTAFVDEKHGLGYRYVSDELTLNRLDRYLVEMGYDKTSLDKEPLLAFLQQLPNEKPSARCRRMTTARQFAEYMVRNGYEAYVIPRKMFPNYEKAFKARILTDAELRRFLDAATRFPPDKNHPIKHREIAVLFHILVNCGLRIAEACKLRIQDVDLENGILHIEDGKNHVNRIVPMSDPLTDMCRTYCAECLPNADPELPFFPGTKSKTITPGTAYDYFRRILWMAGISHGGRRYGGPRLHDLRHTFAVHCLNRWVSTGVELSTALPVLAKYMGHVSISGTQKYLQFTAEMYPETTARMESKFGDLIPEVRHENR